MKILHVFDFFSPWGAGTVGVLYKLLPAMAQKGHEVVLYTSDFKLDQDYIASVPELKVHPFHCVSGLGRFYVTPSLVGAARQHLKDFDIIHLHAFRSFQNIVIHHYARKYGVPYIIDHHGSLPRVAAGETSPKWLLRWFFDVTFGYPLLKDAIKVIANNQFGVKEYKKFGVPDDQIAIIPQSIAVNEFLNLPPKGEFRKKYGLEDKRIIMFLGRIHRIKGLDFLVKSFYELSRARSDVLLAIVGDDDGYKNKLEQLVSKLNISSQVLFTGFLAGQDKLAALVDADVVVQPSRYDYSPLAPYEAVLCGTPVIVSGNSGVGEEMSSINAGYLVEFGDINQMVQLIQSILDDPAKAREKVNRAKEYMVNHMRLSDRVNDYERLYQQCIELNVQSGGTNEGSGNRGRRVHRQPSLR